MVHIYYIMKIKELLEFGRRRDLCTKFKERINEFISFRNTKLNKLCISIFDSEELTE